MKKIILLLTILTLNLCQSQTKGKTEMYKTESGEYASESGNFIIKFPMQPTLTVRAIDNQIGMGTYKIYYYQANAGQQMIYGAEYIDFPESVIKAMGEEKAYNQILKTLKAKYGEAFILTKEEPTETHNLKGHYFEFSLNPEANIPDGVEGAVKGKIIFIKNRAYTITYLGKNQELVEPYFNSFRLIK
jgi:hypothetical protein